MIALDVAGGIATVTLDRPAARNALPTAGWRALADLFARVPADAAALVVASSTPGVFSAGADLADLARLVDDVPARTAFRQAMQDAVEALAALPMPTVAAVGGAAFGAGQIHEVPGEELDVRHALRMDRTNRVEVRRDPHAGGNPRILEGAQHAAQSLPRDARVEGRGLPRLGVAFAHEDDPVGPDFEWNLEEALGHRHPELHRPRRATERIDVGIAYRNEVFVDREPKRVHTGQLRKARRRA